MSDIEIILDEFDFGEVQKVMEFMDWKWASSDGVPTLGEMRRVARSLLKDVVNNVGHRRHTYCATGGFWAECTQYPGDPKKYLKLSFQVTSWDNYE
jgi:hypothetical protein